MAGRQPNPRGPALAEGLKRWQKAAKLHILRQRSEGIHQRRVGHSLYDLKAEASEECPIPRHFSGHSSRTSIANFLPQMEMESRTIPFPSKPAKTTTFFELSIQSELKRDLTFFLPLSSQLMAETDAPSPVDIHSRTKSLKYKFSCHQITVSVNGQSYVYLTCLPPEPAVLPSWRWVLA